MPHLLGKIKVLNLSNGRITLEKDMKFTQLEELTI